MERSSPKKKNKIKKLEKTLDKLPNLCYNKITKRVATNAKRMSAERNLS